MLPQRRHSQNITFGRASSWTNQKTPGKRQAFSSVNRSKLKYYTELLFNNSAVDGMFLVGDIIMYGQ